MSLLLPSTSSRPSSLMVEASRKKKHHDGDEDDDDHEPKGRIGLLEDAFKRRREELHNLKRAFSESLDGKRPLDPPAMDYGTAVQRAWLHSVDPHDYRERLERLMDGAEESLVRLEERL
ncbi:hypothetical protein BGX28_008078 [Mortierella sp. GBA30]|nr:hypothetical protein BGX28_008078 [Mortierella sp. GBA30]